MYRVEFNGDRELLVEELNIPELEKEAGADGWFKITEVYPELPEEPENGEQPDGPLLEVPQ